MKRKSSAEFDAFTNLVDRVLAVPHFVIQQRVEEARKLSDQNPRKRGPKKKKRPTSTASSHVASSRTKRAA